MNGPSLPKGPWARAQIWVCLYCWKDNVQLTNSLNCSFRLGDLMYLGRDQFHFGKCSSLPSRRLYH